MSLRGSCCERRVLVIYIETCLFMKLLGFNVFLERPRKAATRAFCFGNSYRVSTLVRRPVLPVSGMLENERLFQRVLIENCLLSQRDAVMCLRLSFNVLQFSQARYRSSTKLSVSFFPLLKAKYDVRCTELFDQKSNQILFKIFCRK